jgi:hypothetical protein
MSRGHHVRRMRLKYLTEKSCENFDPTGWQYGASEERLAMAGFRGAQ